MRLRWKRALLKISGEVLGGKEGPLDKGAFSFYAEEIGRHREAGAELVLGITPRWLWSSRRLDRPLTLSELLKEFEGIDLVLAEGFKAEAAPKIEVIRQETGPDPLEGLQERWAVVSDLPVDLGVPCFRFEEVEALAAFLAQRLGLQWAR